MKTKWQLSMAIALILLFVSTVISCSTPAPIPGPPEIEDGWVRLRIEDVGSIDYPVDFLELQSGEYRMLEGESLQIPELITSDFTLQQVGLNELKPSAFDEYRRVMFWTIHMNPGEEVFRANEKYSLSQEELAEFQNELIDELVRVFAMMKTSESEMKLVESISLEVIEVHVMFPLVHTYKRQVNDNPIVLVRHYMFQKYDRIHHLTFSHRVVDEEECKDTYDKILDSFRLK